MGAVESSQQRRGPFVEDSWWNPPSQAVRKQGSTTEGKQLQEKLEVAEAARKRVEAELSSAKKEVAQLEEEVQDLEQQLSDAEEEKQQVSQQLEGSERSRKQQAEQLREGEAEQRRLRQLLQEAEEQRRQLEARVATLERRVTLAQDSTPPSPRPAAGAFVTKEARATADSNVSRSPSREGESRARQNRPWLQQTSVTQQGAPSQRSPTSAGGDGSSGTEQQQQQKQEKGQQQQEKSQQQGQQRASGVVDERRTLSASKAAELELFKREVNVKREARQRAMAAVSAELERLRSQLRHERQTRRRLEVRLGQHGDESEADTEEQSQQDEDREEEEEEELLDGEGEGDQRCQVSLEEDMHLKLEQAKNELETERELRRALEDSLEQLRCQLETMERLQLEAEELRGDLDRERQRRTEVECEAKKLRAKVASLEVDVPAGGEDQVPLGVVECLRGQLDSERGVRRQLEHQMQAMMENQLKRDQKESAGASRLKEQLEKEKSARLELERQVAALCQEVNQDEAAGACQVEEQLKKSRMHLELELEKEKSMRLELETQLAAVKQEVKEEEVARTSRLEEQLEREKSLRLELERQLAAVEQEMKQAEAAAVSRLNEEMEREKCARMEAERQLAATRQGVKDEGADDVSRLKEQLEKEKSLRLELERQLVAVRQEARREEAGLLRDLDRLRDELDSERDRKCRASAEAEAERGRAEAGEEERRRLKDQVAALKDVAAVGRQLLQLREEQVERLEARLKASEAVAATPEDGNLAARLPAAVETVVGELRAEYERQLRAMAALRQLYDERAAAAAAEAEERERRLATEEQARRDTEAKCLRLQEEASRSTEEASALREEVSQIHAAFARLLEAASAPAIDALARRLHQNRDLLADIAAEGDEPAALSRTLMELAAQAEAADSQGPTPGADHSDEHIDTATASSATPTASEESATPATAPTLDRSEIVTNLPKVWKVLLELLSQQQAAGDSGESPAEATGDDVKSHCYKSVDTPYGPRLVISVSQTFLRLKELILEKKSLQRELSRLQQLNGHLETELGRQQQRLSLVSSELRKTWGVVGRMRAQHRQLHTHETLLRHELQHKRELLRELRDELAMCRETWQRARQKSSQSEVEWLALRTEFAERRRRRDAGSTESGCFSDSGDDAKETPSGGSCSPVAEEHTALEVEDAEDPGSCPTHSEGDDDDSDGCVTVSMVKKLKEQLAWFSHSLESVARDDEKALHSIFSLPAITIPEAVYCKLGWTGDGEVATDSGHPQGDLEEEKLDTSSPAQLEASHEDGGVSPALPDPVTVESEKTQADSANGAVPSEDHPENCTEAAVGTNVEAEVEAEAQRRKRREGAYRRLAACLEAPAAVLEDDFLLARSEAAATAQESAPTPVVAPLDEQALEARAERLSRLEEQCQQLVRKVTRTAHRSNRLSNRLEELHEQYGSSPSPDSSPAAPGSPVAGRRLQRPPPPPPLPSTLPCIPAPPHMPAVLPPHRLSTASDSAPGLRPPPPPRQPPATGDQSGGDSTAEG